MSKKQKTIIIKPLRNMNNNKEYFTILTTIINSIGEYYDDIVEGRESKVSFELVYRNCYTLYINNKNVANIVLKYFLTHQCHSSNDKMKDLINIVFMYAIRQNSNLNENQESKIQDNCSNDEHLIYVKKLIELICENILLKENRNINEENYTAISRIISDAWNYSKSRGDNVMEIFIKDIYEKQKNNVTEVCLSKLEHIYKNFLSK